MILVTGDAGFIGGHLLRALAAAREHPRAGEPLDLLDLRHGQDILDCDLPDADTVIHLAAQPGVVASMEDPERTMLANVQGTVRLAEAYRHARFVFASSGGTIQETIASPYGLSKKMGEDYLKLRHPDAVILRFANVYGPGSRSVIDKFLSEPDELTIYGDGSATRTYVHVDDLVRGIIASLDWPAGSYYFGSGQHYSVQQIADAVGKPVRYEDWRPGELHHASLENTAPDWEPTIDALDYIAQARHDEVDGQECRHCGGLCEGGHA